MFKLVANLNGGFYLKTKAEMENGTGKNFSPESVFHFRLCFLVGNPEIIQTG